MLITPLPYPQAFYCQLPRPLLPHPPKPPEREHSKKHLRTMKDPVARTNSPYTNPSVKGPRSQLFTNRPSAAAANSKSSFRTST